MVDKNLSSSRFANHEKSKGHVASCGGVENHGPPLVAFERVLRSLWLGNSIGDGQHQTGKRKKVRCMIWALAEAKRQVHREQLNEASTMSLHQDASKGVIVLRFTACGSLWQQKIEISNVSNQGLHTSFD
jgi:hypothetical protein